MKTINPHTGRVDKTYETHGNQDIERILSRAANAYKNHAFSDVSERCKKLSKLEQNLLENKERYARLMTSEMGKLYSIALMEVEKCASLCGYFAKNAPRFLEDEVVETDSKQSYIRYLPIGAILAVMPWNFPFWQVFRFAVPALAAGNVALLKHASNVPGCAQEIEKIFRDSGFDQGEFQTLMIASDKVERVIEDPRVRAVTLTGSEGAGRSVAQTSAKVLKKTVLELGGSDPFIVMPSADLDHAVSMAVKGRLQNNGQTCIAAKRYIVHADVYEDFKQRLVEAYEQVTVGDPMDEGTDLGPLSSAQIRDELSEQVEQTISAGGQMIFRSQIPVSEGFYFPAMLIEDIPKDSPAYKDELFGPVGLLFKASSFEDAIELANDTRFGLGSAIFTQNEHEKDYAATHIQAGGTYINTIMASDIQMPFGGVKDSGYGRELTALGMREFMNIKTIVER